MRLEIAAILERKIRAIPVLVGGAVVPKSSQLPDSLAPLVRRNAFEISDGRFHSDVDKLIQALEKVLADLVPPISTQASSKPNIPPSENTTASVSSRALEVFIIFSTVIFPLIGLVTGAYYYLIYYKYDRLEARSTGSRLIILGVIMLVINSIMVGVF